VRSRANCLLKIGNERETLGRSHLHSTLSHDAQMALDVRREELRDH
jgi:hypothetical protein